jgi:hypothetical protein
MRGALRVRRVGLFVGIASLVLIAASMHGATQVTSQGAGGVSAVLQPERCYPFKFSITAAPNYKVLERLDDGWIKAEVDAGPSSARREPLWINTAQIITVREARCSD